MKAFATILAIASVIPSIQGLAIEKRGTPIRTGWTNKFWDDFKDKVGGLPNEANWIIDTGTQYPGGDPGWGNWEVQTYTRNTANLKIVDGGYLVITPLKDAQGKWTSGRIESKRTDFQPGYNSKMLIETRLKVGNNPASKQQGIWPAFWALGAEYRGNYQNWPKVTEWDILELINGRNELYSTVHCGIKEGGPCNEPAGKGSGGANQFNRDAFRVLGFEIDRKNKSSWKEETIKWFLDGKLIYTLKGSAVNDYDSWMRLVAKGHFLLFNVAVGGSWPKDPNAQTEGGAKAELRIDWVGVWTA